MRLVIRVEQDVRRLEVAVQHAALMGVMDRPRHLHHDLGRRPRPRGETIEFPGQAAALEQFHAEVQLPVPLAHLVDRHDPRVVQERHRLGLFAESLLLHDIAQLVDPHHLESHDSIEAELSGFVDDALAASPDFSF